MNRNPSPKSEFVSNSILIKNHHDLLENPSLQIGIDAALSEIQRRAAQNTPPENFNACAASHLRLLGAQDFIDVFLNLAETDTPSTRPASLNLPSNLPTVPTSRKN